MKPCATWTGILVWVSTAGAIHAIAAEVPTSGPVVVVTRALIEQKEALVKRLLADSSAVRRMEASGEATKHLAAAQQAYDKATTAFSNNDLRGADKLLNDATILIGKARQLAPDSVTRDVENRVRYSQMRASVESLKSTYHRHLQRVSGQSEQDTQLAGVSRLIDIAKNQANAKQYTHATRTLATAEKALMVNIGRILGARTIEYAQRFETPAEEYGFELDRNRSYVELIPIALGEFKPGGEVIRRVNDFTESNRQLREQAQQYAAKQRYAEALVALRGGTAQLQSALAATGLSVPPDTKLDTAGRP